MSAGFDEALALLRSEIDRLSFLIASCRIMEQRLVEWGLPEEKITLIPLAVDLDRFKPPDDPDQSSRLRMELGIPQDAICIGSFQKDGEGWDEGLRPKMIKGPDIFVKSVEALSRQYPVHVLLTGPARGYVKTELERMGVPYSYRYLSNANEVPRMFGCLDLYLVASREEGGPKAILESMASGVPCISTRVGMAPDIIRHGQNGAIVEVEDIDAIVREACKILDDRAYANGLVQQGLQTAQDFSVHRVAEQHYRKVYSATLNALAPGRG